MDEKIRQILHKIISNKMIRSEDIPNIDLYMDQVTTLMEKHLSQSKRYDSDKIMTKTMINNYSKNHLLPPSNKKKYTKEHIFLLVMIYYYKNMLSISDIQNLLSPLSEKYFPKNPENGMDLETIYTQLMDQLSKSGEKNEQQILESLESSHHLFSSYSMKEEEKQELSTLTFISQLCYDILIRKQLIERLIDEVYPPENSSSKNTSKKEKQKKGSNH